MPPKKRGAKAPAKAKKEVKKQPARKPAKKPAKEPATKLEKIYCKSECCGVYASTRASIEEHEEMCLEYDPRPWGRNRTKPVEPATKPTTQAARLREEAASFGPTRPGPTKEDVRCYTVTSKDSITGIDLMRYPGPVPLLEHGYRNDTWDINVDEDGYGETILTHQSTGRCAYMSREDAVEAASMRLIDRIIVYASNTDHRSFDPGNLARNGPKHPALLQLPDDYFKFDGAGEAPDDERPFEKDRGGAHFPSKLLYDLHRDVYPVQRDVVTTEPEPTMWLHVPFRDYISDEIAVEEEEIPASNAHAKVDTVHEWTKQFTYSGSDSVYVTDREGASCECEAKFSTTVTSRILRQSGEDSDVEPDSN